MKTFRPVQRFQSQLLNRRSYRPLRILRVRPETLKLNLVFRPVRAGQGIKSV